MVKLKLYLISQDVNRDYDTFSDAVVCAESEDDAKTIHPSGMDYNPELKCWGFAAGSGMKGSERTSFEPYGSMGSWVMSPNFVSVKEIGNAKKGIERGVICASFHAG